MVERCTAVWPTPASEQCVALPTGFAGYSHVVRDDVFGRRCRAGSPRRSLISVSTGRISFRYNDDIRAIYCRGSAMPQKDDYTRARERAEAKYGFLVHAVVYAAVLLLLLIINLLTSPGTLWFIWPLLGWGLAVTLHGARVFLFADRNAMIDALTERELRQSRTNEDPQ